eukprot:scaffold23273_cov69-Skeletonema_marinoi.AAC.1
MSRWLKNVNALLENLDNQVEETVEEHRFNRALDGEVDADGNEGIVGDASEEAQGVEDILAKRGLLSEEDDEIVDDNVNAGSDIDDTPATSGDNVEYTNSHDDNLQGEGEHSDTSPAAVKNNEEEPKSDVKEENNVDDEGGSQSDDADVADPSSGGVEESETPPEVPPKSNASKITKKS